MSHVAELDTRALVRPSVALRHFTMQRYAPPPPLGRVVDRCWKTAWSLDAPYIQPIVTFPVVNLVFQADGSAMVTGPLRGVDQRELHGTGWAFGVMFRPGGFAPLVDAPMATFVDRRCAAEDLWGDAARALADAVLGAGDDAQRVELVSAWIVPRLPAACTTGEMLSRLVETSVHGDPPVTRVEELAARHGTSVRTLQRLFAQHVGLPPKQVLDRYRVQRAAATALAPVRSWADVAQRLGYSDQAHLTADVSDTYGMPPAAYARAETARPAISRRRAAPVGAAPTPHQLAVPTTSPRSHP